MDEQENAVSGLIGLLKKNGYTVINDKERNYNEPILIKKEIYRMPTIILKDTPVGALSCREYYINGREVRYNTV